MNGDMRAYFCADSNLEPTRALGWSRCGQCAMSREQILHLISDDRERHLECASCV